ncbi:MAG TPA: hypothetical protein H9980_03860 [Candidatus Erysipelatoclostridium merdavium]|uniref:Cell surface protein Shp haem-binding domain-containing protein n=1 Tax=Candidatus Erysipelatoclostridium merdavium TaxID=2838566 RepID=A0A9D1XKQ0_9FIRM|nr:hypothetical protein [Candidatus Erysipelatoclostridium merdavium]
MAIKKIVLTLITILTLVITIKPAFALDDGAYLVGRSTSYVNPHTGSPEDDGTNIALGESMCSNIISSQLLLEQTGGKYYLTFEINLADNISNYSFKIMNISGSFRNASASELSTSTSNAKRFRIQVNSPSEYISPIIYVVPMGRNVQFFFRADVNSATPGTGMYESQMVPATSNSSTDQNNESSSNEENVSQETVVTNTTENQQVGTINKESLMENVTGLSNYIIDDDGKVDKDAKLTVKNLKKDSGETKEQTNNLPMIIGGVVMVVLIAVAGGIYYVKKVKK